MPILTAPEKPTHSLHGASFTSLATPRRGSQHTAVWRVELLPGSPGTPHQVTREEVFVVLSGRARVRLAEDVGEVTPGDVIVVPSDTPFELSAIGDEPMQALCCMPVGGQARLLDGTTFVPPWAL